MKESKQVVKALKSELKRQGKTYTDLTGVLDLSHASVKRLFAEENFTLNRLEAICQFLNINFAELIRSMEKSTAKIDQLSIEQEMEFVNDTRFLCFAHSVLNRWSFGDIINTYEFDQHEGIKMLAKLDKMKLIEMLPGNRYKLLVSRNFSWNKSGPIQNFFERELQADYFDSKFSKADELRLFISVTLSPFSVEEIKKRLLRLSEEVGGLHLEDEALERADKKGISLVLAMRPWETRVFSALRRK